MSNENITNPKPPTERDLKMLAYMDEGNTLDNISAMKLFGCAGVRDMIYRCRQSGVIILHRDIKYKTKDGVNKKYRQWYTKEPLIPATGAKTEKALKGASVGDFSRKIAKICKPAQAVLF